MKTNKIKFLKEQDDVINCNDKNLLVSASAGSGKTTIMIEKIVRLVLQENVSLSKLLVLTYTNSASNDMKNKLEMVLKNNNVSQDILDDLPNCDISTIHSFCQKQLKRHFQYADLDNSFEVVDDSKKMVLKNEAIVKTFSFFKKNNQEEFLNLLKTFKNGRTEKTLKKLIYAVEDFLSPIANKQAFKEREIFKVYDDIENNRNILNGYFVRNINSFKMKFHKFINQADALCSSKCVAFCNQIISLLDSVNHNFQYLYNFESLSQIKLPTMRGFSNEDSVLISSISKEKSNLSKFINSALKLDLRDENKFKQRFLEYKKIISFILNIESEYEKQFLNIKKEKKVLDFSDLETKMLTLLDNEEICEVLKQRYDYIYVDEYQDANQIQEALISKLCRKNNRFMVGDVKQSIYGFRHSNPDIFLQKEAEYLDRDDSTTKYLNVNFRSDKTILEFVNLVFSKIMTKKTCGIDYLTTSVFNAFKNYGNIGIPKVKIRVFDQDLEKIKKEPDKIYSVKTHVNSDDEYGYAEREAQAVANEILLLYEKEIKVDGESKKLKFNDISILVRKRGAYFDRFCSKLIELGVPVYASNNNNLLDNVEVLRIINLLKLASNPLDEIALVSSMRSNVGGFTEKELVEIRKTSNETFYYCLYKSLEKGAPISLKINTFLSLMDKFRKNITYYGIYEAIQILMRECSYKYKLLPLTDGHNRVECLEKLLRVIKSSEYNFNLASLLEYLELENTKIKAPDFYLGDSDCVNISTIHSSKGLEYPVVFLVDCGNNFMRDNQEKDIEANEKLGIFLKTADVDEGYNLISSIIKIQNQLEDFAERLRLLYVAMTRAKLGLYIFGTTKLKELTKIENDLDVLSMRSYLSLILGSFNQNEFDKIEKKQDFSFDEIDVSFAEDIVEKKKNKKVMMFGKPNKNFVEKITKNFIKNEKKSIIALKNSVSSIVSTEQDYVSLNTSPKFLHISEHLSDNTSADEIGTLYHKALENLEFNNVNNIFDIKSQLASVIDCDKLDCEKILKCVYVLKQLFENKQVEKEKKFIMNIPYNEICDSNICDKVLVQGVIDCFSKDGILVDYKFTKYNDKDHIIKRYSKQIFLYKKALELAFGLKNIKCYILLINKTELLQIF